MFVVSCMDPIVQFSILIKFEYFSTSVNMLKPISFLYIALNLCHGFFSRFISASVLTKRERKSLLSMGKLKVKVPTGQIWMHT